MRYINHESVLGSDLDAKYDAKNPGGGVQSKVWNIQRAFPNMEVSSELGDTINLIDPMWINIQNTKKTHEKKLKAITESNAINIMWQEELAMFRLTAVVLDHLGNIKGDWRFEFYRKMDAVFNCNQYLNTMMKAYMGMPMHILYTPIDEQLFRPAPTKRKQIVAMGKISHQKNVQGLINMFQALPSDIKKIYIGSADTWGTPETKIPFPVRKTNITDDEWNAIQDEYYTRKWQLTLDRNEYYENLKLQNELKKVCEWHPALNKTEVANILSESWGYLNMSRYDTGCLSFLESAMSGCHCFCWKNHPMFDEYLYTHRFGSVKDGAEKIVETLKVNPDANLAMRESVEDKHGYTAVQDNLKKVIGEVLI